jgi:hypothetical protein
VKQGTVLALEKKKDDLKNAFAEAEHVDFHNGLEKQFV